MRCSGPPGISAGRQCSEHLRLTLPPAIPKVIPMPASSLEEILQPFRFLVGHWQGRGVGLWDPDSSFEFQEDLKLELIPGRAIIRLTQRTVEVPSGSLSHSELGFLRLFEGGEAELVVAIPAGYTEVHEGRLEGQELQLRLVTLGVAPRARPLSRTGRSLALRAGQLHHHIDIAVGEGAPVAHVASSLNRVGA